MSVKLTSKLRLRIDDEPIERLAVPVAHPDEGRQFHRRLTDRAGEWRVDAIAPLIPWHADGVYESEHQKFLFVRLAVLRAWEDARRVEGQRRGHREAVLNIRKGDPLLGGARLPDLLGRASEDASPAIDLIAGTVAERLGIALEGDREDGARLRAAATGTQHQGRSAEVELPTFVRTLAWWWWRNTGRRPEKQINAIRKANGERGTPRAPTFFDLAVAAAVDCSRSGKAEPEGVRSAIRREIERMEEEGEAPWPRA